MKIDTILSSQDAAGDITVASIPPGLSPFEDLKDKPFLTRGQTALLMSSTPGVLLDTDREMVIMTDIFDHPARESIIAVVKNGYMGVFPNHQFKPEALISRAELASSLSLLLGPIVFTDSEDGSQVMISDLPKTNRHFVPVQRAVSLGLMGISPDGRFGPALPVTGAEGWDVFLRLSNLISGRKG